MPNTVVHTIRGKEIGQLLDWAADEGWNPGLNDAAAFQTADPSGFLGLFVDGVMASAISAIRYGDDFGFIGLYICRQDYRGRGLGRQVWEEGLGRLRGRTVGLDGVVAQQASYAREDFVLAHRTIRFEGKAPDMGSVGNAAVEIGEDAPSGLIEAIAAYDRSFFPGWREDFLRAWLVPCGRRTVAHISDGAVTGYGTIRECRTGYKIGPLFADDDCIASRIFTALLSPMSGAQVAIDIPEPNRAWCQLVEGAGLSPAFETARMYRGPSPTLPLERIFGITTFELG